MASTEFDRWFDGSHVVDDNGLPQKVFRGEHGSTSDGDFQTVIGNYTFTECPQVASTYAQQPNNRSLSPLAEQPRVTPAYLVIFNPILKLLDDPFAELGELENKLGRAFVTQMAIKHDRHIENTNNWQEEVGLGHKSVESFLTLNPEGLSMLYMDAYVLLDDPEFVKVCKEAGYDGAMHIGNGESATVMEYRVFDRSQIRFAVSCPEARASKALDFMENLPKDSPKQTFAV